MNIKLNGIVKSTWEDIGKIMIEITLKVRSKCYWKENHQKWILFEYKYQEMVSFITDKIVVASKSVFVKNCIYLLFIYAHTINWFINFYNKAIETVWSNFS